MTDTEIIKALECCGYGIMEKCRECPLINQSGTCMYKLKREAHNLINRQKAEIDRLEENENTFAKRFYKEGIRDFAEKLKKGFASLEHRPEIHRKTIEVEKFINIVNWVLHEVTTKEIDHVVKEMVGEDNDKL